MPGKRLCIGWRATLAIFAIVLFATSTFADTADQVLHGFNLNGMDGVTPQASLVIDAGGVSTARPPKVALLARARCTGWSRPNLPDPGWKGSAQLQQRRRGRGQSLCRPDLRCGRQQSLWHDLAGGTEGVGTVFALKHKAAGGWKEIVLYSFKNRGNDGINPRASLVFDTAGNLYGTTYGGGLGFGTVFELSPAAGGVWTEKVLHRFKSNGKDGMNPYAGLVIDAAGNLYGTTPAGGNGFGTVFELMPAGGGKWSEKTLHKFKNDGKDGINPYAGVIFDFGDANLYGVTYGGGFHGFGTLFSCHPWREGSGGKGFCTASRATARDGINPEGGLIFDPDGNLYGTTVGGGAQALGWCSR